MSRSLAREYAFKKVYEFLFNKDNNNQSENTEENSTYQNLNNINNYDNFLQEFTNEISEEEIKFSFSIFNAVKNNYDQIAFKIASNLKKNLSIKDIYKLDLAILLISISEIDFLNEPIALSINEAIKLAKKYSTEKSPSFINGVLSSIYNNK